MVGRINVGDDLMLMYTIYQSFGPYDFIEMDLLSFFYNKSKGANEPKGVVKLESRGMVCRIYVGNRFMLS
ncbi:MAG: hypothetical protein N0C90_21580, partial [Candidatus Thiodiazotropha endolucinida]|nr:hypothetical protein [Candidatus Thiodiazotropha taylori]MCW4263947.1 hypothetical protein [Candidatus Thiodiazotropha endolucinida]